MTAVKRRRKKKPFHLLFTTFSQAFQCLFTFKIMVKMLINKDKQNNLFTFGEKDKYGCFK